MLPDERQHQGSIIENSVAEERRRKAGQLVQALCRVTREFEMKVGRRPSNLVLMNKRLTNGFWDRTSTGFLDDIVPILKGYFVWCSHVVKPTAAEEALLQGYPAVRSGHGQSPWTPPEPIDGSLVWTTVPHVVKIGTDVFSVTRDVHYAQPL